ncbi:MAG: hypothetical protein KKI15_20265 [Proteobacteria bacterium]|nr:hypothetical protein [Pseudomonadota bacterium]
MGKIIFVIVGGMVATFTVGAAVNAAQLADVVTGPGSVEWVPINTAGEGYYTLSVSTPDGTLIKNSFATNEIPVYSGTVAEPFVDGNYAYELVLNPVPRAAARQIKGAIPDENGRPRDAYSRSASVVNSKPPTQTGSFTVVDGNVIDPNTKE